MSGAKHGGMFTGLLQGGEGWRCKHCHPDKLTMVGGVRAGQ